jgi:hypothetical protein
MFAYYANAQDIYHLSWVLPQSKEIKWYAPDHNVPRTGMHVLNVGRAILIVAITQHTARTLRLSYRYICGPLLHRRVRRFVGCAILRSQ